MTTIRVVSDGGIGRWADGFAGLSAEGARIMAQNLNRAARPARTALIRDTARAVGCSVSRVRRVVRTILATAGAPSFEVRATDRFMSLADPAFSPREMKGGTRSRAWGVSKLYEGGFYRAGRWPNRVEAPALGGEVYDRTTGARTPLRLLHGPNPAVEMVKGDPLAGWLAGTDRIAARIVAELQRRLALGS